MTSTITISGDAANICDFNPDTEQSLAARAEWLAAMAVKMTMDSVPGNLSDDAWKAILNNAIAVQMFPIKLDPIESLEGAVDAVRASHPEAKDMPLTAAMAVIEVLRVWWCEYTSYREVQLNDFDSFKRVVDNLSGKKKK